MHGMQYPPERTIRPEEILPIGTNPIGRIEKTLRFFLFPGWPANFLRKKTWPPRMLHLLKHAAKNGRPAADYLMLEMALLVSFEPPVLLTMTVVRLLLMRLS